jgi:hypothetical protein
MPHVVMQALALHFSPYFLDLFCYALYFRPYILDLTCTLNSFTTDDDAAGITLYEISKEPFLLKCKFRNRVHFKLSNNNSCQSFNIFICQCNE